MPRTVTRYYQDPLELIWIHAAGQMGMTIERNADVYASWDGAGTLQLGPPETLDDDDCVAQMVFHETCHALIEGPAAWDQIDWGLRMDDPNQRVREYACLRLQAALADQHGLRNFLGSTTVFRCYYDELPSDPLAECEDPAVPIAREGWERATTGPWSDTLQRALQDTRRLREVVHSCAPETSLWAVD